MARALLGYHLLRHAKADHERERAMRITEWCFAVALGTASGLCGCGGSEPAATAPVPAASAPSPEPAPVEPVKSTKSAAASQPLDGKPKPDMPPPGSSLDRVMHAHFKDALLIRQAVIAGTPDQAAEPARLLALSQNVDDVPPGWREFVERMQQVARRITHGTSTAQTASAVADLGMACGQCHQQQGGPAVSNGPPPAEGISLEQRMKRHAWATERLWEGLIIPSSEAWNAGSRALVDAPFPEEVLKQGGVHARSAASDFKHLVAQAPTKKTAEERAALYAALLVTCGTCHRSRAGDSNQMTQ